MTIAEREGSEITQYADFAIEYRDASHSYWIHVNDQRVRAISVTSALKVLDKPALVGWAERLGCEGALRLEREGELAGVAIEAAIDVVRINKMGTVAKRDAGAGRGTAVHDTLQLYCSEGTIPNIKDFDPAVRGYVSGLCAWLIGARPEPIMVEQVVGSPTHLYAGRLDLLANINGRRTLVDLKTNPAGRVYTEAHLQAAAYGHALVECEGVEAAPDDTLILAVGAEGQHETQVCCSEIGQFLAVLACNRAVSAVRSSARGLQAAA